MALLNELLKEYGVNKIPYSLLLETEEWKSKRKIIIKRDNEKCTCCHRTEIPNGERSFFEYEVGILEPKRSFLDKLEYYEKLLEDKFVGISANSDDYEYVLTGETNCVPDNKLYCLQVHHKYYVDGKFPWDYDNEALVTLCNWCHFELHQTQIIPFYNEINYKRTIKAMTPCLKCHGAGFIPEFTHIQLGICFDCNGLKYEELITEKK